MTSTKSGATLVASGDANEALSPPERDGLTRVRVLWYSDGSMRIRVYHTPMAITEAYLQGGTNDHSIIRLTPTLPKVEAEGTKAERTPLRHTCFVDPTHHTFGYYRIMRGDEIEAYVCQRHIEDLSPATAARLVIVSEEQAKKEAGIW